MAERVWRCEQDDGRWFIDGLVGNDEDGEEVYHTLQPLWRCTEDEVRWITDALNEYERQAKRRVLEEVMDE